MRRILDSLSRPFEDGRWPIAVFALAFVATFVAMVITAWELYFGEPLYEVGDLAANALQIDRAKELRELYGNYSRFGFHHPGPAFFYVYAVAELVFRDVPRLSPAPHNAHLLGAAILHSGLLAATVTVLARFAAPNRLFFSAAAVAIAVGHFALAGQHQYSIWPPSALVVPFAAFLALCVGLSAGVIALLPVLVAIGGLLAHGHVAQPLFVLPLGAMAYLSAVWRGSMHDKASPSSVVRHALGSHLTAIVLLLIFLAPIAIDALDGPPFNVDLIVQTLTATRGPADEHSASAIAAYLLAFLAYPTAGELRFTPQGLLDLVTGSWISIATVLFLAVAAPTVYLLRSRERGSGGPSLGDLRARDGITRIALFAAVAIALCAVWVYMQRGPLYQFNSFFIYGVIYVTMLSGALVAARVTPYRLRYAGTVIAMVLVLAVSVRLGTPEALGEPPTIARSIERFVRSSPPSTPVLLNFDGMHWNAPAAVALTLERLGIPWYVAPHWGLIFGYEHIYPVPGRAEPVVWHLAPPDVNGPDEIVLSPAVSIAGIDPPSSE